jgi:transcriptional regulator with XRE-family HTH domain
VQKTVQQRFGRRINSLREERGLTQEQISERTGLSRQHISNLENGHREACLGSIEKLAAGFALTIAELMQGV